ncbi:hypothetical protein BDR04DRAFT_1164871 [Suillus decipiens]|nr:hypothetical protein BDR04DRAFT_1164871 [Suillus decipiens]
MPPIFQAPDTNSESQSDKESQTGIQGDAESPLSAILGDVPIQNATISMLAEALTKVLQTPEIVSCQAARSTWEKKKLFIEKFTDLQYRDNKLFKGTFHVTKDDDFMTHITASLDTNLSFQCGMGPGPDPLELHWHMETTHTSEWNKKVVDLVCSQYIILQQKNQWTIRSQESIKEDIKQKFTQCCKCWTVAWPRILSNGMHELPRHVEAQLVDHTNERLRLARVLTRRAMKFETQRKVMSTLLSDRKATGKEDEPVWAYLQSIIETLGKDGMGSDESENEISIMR